MREYYVMKPSMCFMCKDSLGKKEDVEEHGMPLVDCDHKVSANLLNLKISELEDDLKMFKKARKYAELLHIKE